MPPKLTPAVRGIVTLSFLFSVACWLAVDFGMIAYAFSIQKGGPSALLQFWMLPSRFFTYFDPSDFLAQMAILWIFGCPLEKRLGLLKFSGLFFLCGLATLIVTCLFGVANYAPWAGVVGVLVGYVKLFPEEKTSILLLYPVKNAHLALIYLAIQVFLAPGSSIEFCIAAVLGYCLSSSVRLEESA